MASAPPCGVYQPWVGLECGDHPRRGRADGGEETDDATSCVQVDLVGAACGCVAGGRTGARIAFLLLIIFMATTLFRMENGLPVTLPRAEAGVPVPRRIATHVYLDARGNVSIDDFLLTVPELRPALARLLGESPALVVGLTVNRAVPYARVDAVIEELKRAGARNVPFTVQPDPPSRWRGDRDRRGDREIGGGGAPGRPSSPPGAEFSGDRNRRRLRAVWLPRPPCPLWGGAPACPRQQVRPRARWGYNAVRPGAAPRRARVISEVWRRIRCP